ncbi:hypothetical protein AB4876_16085 [Zhongshania guokunii]|uniref:Glycosyl transferase family 2 n=1 Tax=Zhongshania guokunii TaxID=641783 RepID=A0ABV3U917_9GAMM
MEFAKVDVAVQSYKKPESLLYTLMTLKAVAGDRIDTVYINDDCSGDATLAYYQNETIRAYFKPWKIHLRSNSKPAGVKQIYLAKYRPKYMGLWFFISKIHRFYNSSTHNKDDVRYQYAIDNTDKKFLFIIHDDVEFRRDIVGLYLQAINAKPNTAAVGDLGQCWRCGHATSCNPKRIMDGYRPSPHWPMTAPSADKAASFSADEGHFACRINEWCCMLDVALSREISRKSGCLFGNYYRRADVAALWFYNAVKLGYKIADPLPEESLPQQININQRSNWYQHGFQGHSGHSIWVDQGSGKQQYQADDIRTRIKTQFGIDLSSLSLQPLAETN